MKYLNIGITLSLLSTSVLASNYWYCPQGGSYVYLGDSPSKVEAACGKPAHTNIVSTQTARQITQWVYNRRSPALKHDAQLPQQPLVINLSNNRVVSIRVLQQAVNSTTFCDARRAITVGDSDNTILAICGKPDYQQRIAVKNQQSPSQTIIYTYNQAYSSPIKLTFKHFKLASIE